MLDRLEAERGASSAQALAAQEGERQRIARNCTTRSARASPRCCSSSNARSTGPRPTCGRSCSASQEMVRASLDEVRQVARRLRPGVLDDLGLVSALTALATDFSQASEVDVTRRLDHALPALTPGGGAGALPHRPGGPDQRGPARQRDAVELSLTADAGRGGAADHRRRARADRRGGGAGIRGMRERALLIGADLTVGTTRHGGTEVRLAVPDAALTGDDDVDSAARPGSCWPTTTRWSAAGCG